MLKISSKIPTSLLNMSLHLRAPQFLTIEPGDQFHALEKIVFDLSFSRPLFSQI